MASIACPSWAHDVSPVRPGQCGLRRVSGLTLPMPATATATSGHTRTLLMRGGRAGRYLRNSPLVSQSVDRKIGCRGLAREEADTSESGALKPVAKHVSEVTSDTIEELETELKKEEKEESAGALVAAWVGAAMIFGTGLGYFSGAEKAEEFFAGYLLEQSLSIDNLFVFILIFKYFKVEGPEQDTVLSYGIWTAAVLRGVMAFAGVELVDQFRPVLLGFAVLLLYSAYGILAAGDSDEEEDINDNAIVKVCRRFITVGDRYDGSNFFTMQDGVRVATPLLLVLAVIELSDVVFAVDSIPAIFGVTLDPFIVYTSNMFAIANLRALYSFISAVMGDLHFLENAVGLVLGYIGSKMILEYNGFEIPTSTSLCVVASLLAGGVALSYILPEPESADE